MATSSATKGPKLIVLPFDPYGDRLNLGKRWDKWFERFERDLKYNGCDPSKTPEIAKMALLIYAGTEVEDLHDTLPTPDRPEDTDEAAWTTYEQSKTKLRLQFSPKQCNDFAIFELLRMKPELSESITSYSMRLRKAASKSDFTNWSAEKMIKSLIISNTHDDTLRLKFLQKDRTLDQILEMALKKEDAVARSKVIDGDSRREVNNVRAKPNQPSPHQGTCPSDQCNRCGHDKHFPPSECPGMSRICNYCKKKGHYASKCFKKQKEAGIKRIEAESQSDVGNDTSSDNDEYDIAKIELVNSLGTRSKPSLMKVRTNDHEVLWQPDTGTQKDVWDEAYFHSYNKKTGGKVKLTPTNIQLFAYGSKTPLTVIGSFKAVLTAGERTAETEIYVTSEPSAYPLLSE
mgnify:CR=1 FL=1